MADTAFEALPMMCAILNEPSSAPPSAATTPTALDRTVLPMAAERILIVDDENYVRTVMGAMLDRSGYITTLAASGQAALAHLQGDTPCDLVLSDMMMSGMDGMALLEHIHRIRPDLPLVMVTAVHDISVAMGAIRRGAYDYLLKPFEREQLLATVARALDHSRLVNQNALYKHHLEQLVAARTDMLRKAMADLERSYDITLEALGDSLDLRDAETEGHSKRVTAYTIALARASGMHSNQLRIIARGAFLHDIGKIAIPDSILLKPGALDEQERAIMREHCTRGYLMLRKIPFLREAAEIVHAHQERFDGSGYPRGLRGDDIPAGARVFAIADTLDAITSDRPYRRAKSFEAARDEISRCSGTQFDPEFVRLFESLPVQIWMDLRTEISLHKRQFSPLEYVERAEALVPAEISSALSL
ncbi:MAG: HD domain-containing phosphohydrolase [Acidobacteriaceae bacterium]